MPAIAFLGLGHMGTPMAHRLVAAGHEVTVWNRTFERTAPLVEAGARAAPTPAEAVAGAEVVITMLADPAAVDSVLFGQSGAAPALAPGACLVDMSTIGPDAVLGVGARLPAGTCLVDAPVNGGPAHAVAGELRILAGGAPDDLARVEPVLAELGTVIRCGELGAGASAKLVSNTCSVAGMALLGEAVSLARSLGVSRELMMQVLSTGALSGVLARAQADGVNFAVSLAAKDLGLAVGKAGDAPVAAAALAVVRAAIDQHAKEDVAVLANL
jgi:3-hydroxyisobutyrate dehydrogenase-like beta-hydroxyacid dehydrogenase